MNQMVKPDRHSQEIARIREIVERHPFPPIITGFDVRLGEFDGDPALWVTFNIVAEEKLDFHQMEELGEQLNAITSVVRADLLSSIEDRYPYFRFAAKASEAAT